MAFRFKERVIGADCCLSESRSSDVPIVNITQIHYIGLFVVYNTEFHEVKNRVASNHSEITASLLSMCLMRKNVCGYTISASARMKQSSLILLLMLVLFDLCLKFSILNLTNGSFARLLIIAIFKNLQHLNSKSLM